MQRPTVFLHAGWRCGSTYAWNKFRLHDDVLAFYEPFNERLARCTPDDLRSDSENAWDSRHPQLNAPYFAEYLPLLDDAGVPRYEQRFAVQRYFIPTQQPLDEAAYLASLLRHAAESGKQAVLGFSRSLGRVGAIKRVFGGCHIVLMRNPVQQWLSARSQRIRHGSPYFEIGPLMILALAPRLSLAGRIAQWLEIPHLRFGSFGHHYRQLRRRFEPLDDELSYRAFLAVYLLSYSRALRHADVILDMDRLSRLPPYARAMGAELSEACGVDIDFADCSMPEDRRVDARVNVRAIQREVSERILLEQPDALPMLLPYEGPIATGEPRRA